MFKYHGFSGPCPKAPLAKKVQVSIDARDDGYWVVAKTASGLSGEIGPFTTVSEAGRTANDMQRMINGLCN